MITLTFSRASPHTPVSVRAAFFRICPDSTLRAPDSGVVATYAAHRWRLGARSCQEFLCSGSVFLRVTHQDGAKERLGPFEFLRAAEGALFTNGRLLGMHSVLSGMEAAGQCWLEVAILSPDGENGM